MAFHYVDRIYEIESGKHIRGLKNITLSEPFWYLLPNNQYVISPAVVTEGLAQLGAWLEMHGTDFTQRPVLLTDELTVYHRPVTVGEQIELYVKIVDSDDNIITSYGEARVGDQVVATSYACRGFLLPIEEFDDRSRVLTQFNTLFKPDFARVPSMSANLALDGLLGERSLASHNFIDGIIDLTVGKQVSSFKNFTAAETFFATHFPRKPVVPGVLLTTLVGETAQLMLPRIDGEKRNLIPTCLKDVRFRKFVEPGDQVRVDLQLVQGNVECDDQDIILRGNIFANGNRVMTADMGFRTMFGHQSNALNRPIIFAAPR